MWPHHLQVLVNRFPVDRDSVDVTDVNQRTALHWAAAHGRHDQVPPPPPHSSRQRS